jgi:hypothetical protein
MSLVLMMLLIAPVFYMGLSRAMHRYPIPEPYHQEQPAPGEKTVIFRVLADTIPENAYVFVTGKQTKLGEWQPDKTPLIKKPEGSWERMISFPSGTLLKYKFTLGTWKTERLNPDGSTPEHYEVLVRSDTTLVHHASGWREPDHLFIIDIMLVYMGLTLISILMLVYGQFILAWESGYFELILVQPVNYLKYFRAKYILLLVFGGLVFLICTPLVLIERQILLINTILLIYSIGINPIVMLLMATYARKRLDLQASVFSTQGKGASQFVLILPTLIIPTLIFLPFAVSGHTQTGYIFLFLTGVAGCIFYRRLNLLVLHFFYRQRHNIISGFRSG